ncbi:MAG: hypothetical protein ACPG8K_01555 [Crocinitomicaceae bacterium]
MKIISLITCCLISFCQFAQQSIIFKNPLPTREGKVLTVDRSNYGTFKTSDEMINYIFDDKGVSVYSTTISSISKEMIREMAKYDVRNGYLFGIIEDDSIPCVFEDDRYYFGLRTEQTIVGEDTRSQLTKISRNEYLLNSWVDGNFVPTHIRFNANGCEFSYFDYGEDDLFFNEIRKKQILHGEYFQVLILDPDQKETTKLLKEKIFSETQKLTKI